MLKRVNEGIRHLPRRRKRVFLKNLNKEKEIYFQYAFKKNLVFV